MTNAARRAAFCFSGGPDLVVIPIDQGDRINRARSCGVENGLLVSGFRIEHDGDLVVPDRYQRLVRGHVD